MKNRSPRKIHLAIIGILILTAAPALAQEPVRKGGTFYLGFALPFNSFQGDYSRNVTTTRKGDVEVDSRMGWGALIGWGSRSKVIEFCYLSSAHTITFTNPGLKGDVAWNQINLDGRYHLFGQKPISPYLLLGASAQWLIPKKKEDFTRTPLDRGTFWTIGLNLGAGLTGYLPRYVSISAGIVYRMFWGFATYIPIGDPSRKSVHDELTGKGLNFVISFRFHFK